VAKPRGKYKDSGNELFEVTTTHAVPRRLFKKVFDRGKADLLSDLHADPRGTKAVEAARALDFDKFLKELHSNFSQAAEMNEIETNNQASIREWAEGEFESWAIQPY
jgi:hypothetical protein